MSGPSEDDVTGRQPNKRTPRSCAASLQRAPGGSIYLFDPSASLLESDCLMESPKRTFATLFLERVFPRVFWSQGKEEENESLRRRRRRAGKQQPSAAIGTSKLQVP